MKKSPMLRVYLAAILSSTIIGFSYLFSKIGLQYSNPLDLLAYRFTFAFLAVLIAIAGWATLEWTQKIKSSVL